MSSHPTGGMYCSILPSKSFGYPIQKTLFSLCCLHFNYELQNGHFPGSLVLIIMFEIDTISTKMTRPIILFLYHSLSFSSSYQLIGGIYFYYIIFIHVKWRSSSFQIERLHPKTKIIRRMMSPFLLNLLFLT